MRRSVLYVPGSNLKALAKVKTLSVDAVIIDLEDAVAPEHKQMARQSACSFVKQANPSRAELVIRINDLSTIWGEEDVRAACACAPDAILLPKVNGPDDVIALRHAIGTQSYDRIGIWGMIETADGVLNVGSIARLGRDPLSDLQCLVVGTNDLAKETGVRITPDRRYLMPWLMQIVLAGRAGTVDVVDGVSNDYSDLDAFENECLEGRLMGFDGKTLIHPLQIEPCNRAFSPSDDEINAARKIVDAFALKENEGRGAISLNGRMVELLHFDQARKLLLKVEKLRQAGSIARPGCTIDDDV